MAGFGGVAEYGITVRWNKNFLKLIRLLLERRAQFSMFGGVRFGGTLTIDSAFEMGFDHVALCAGAGRPTVIPMKNGLARGVRQASDFLMALQLTGAAKTNSVANLQLRLPIVVIGGGLTAIDTATESLAYYVVQVEKFLERYETLVAEKGEREVRAGWTAEETETADEFLAHAYAIRAERALAAREGRDPKLAALLNTWGGVTIAYRRRLIDAPSYTLNHEEVALALRGRHPLRGIADAARGRARSVRPCRGAASESRLRRAGADARQVDSGGRGNAAQHRARTRRSAQRFPGRQVVPGGGRRRPAGETGARGEAGASLRADVDPQGRPRHQLLRRSASFLRRQRGEGHGQRQAGLSGGVALARPQAAFGAAAGRTAQEAQLRAARRGEGSHPADAEHRRSGGGSADGGARVPARTVLSPAELRNARAARQRNRARAWKAWRSPARRSIAKKGCSRPSCSKWADRPICARCSSRASR